MNHHPPLELLIDHVVGKLPAPFSVAIETHLDLCPASRKTVKELEAVSGAMLDELAPAVASPTLLSSIFEIIDHGKPEAEAREKATSTVKQPAFIPQALSRYLNKTFDDLPWRRIAGLFDEAIIPAFAPPYRLSILRAKPGEFVPLHSHHGRECLVVLNGGFQADGVSFEPGDFAFCEAGATHEPTVDSKDPCICLLALDAPLEFLRGDREVLDRRFQTA